MEYIIDAKNKKLGRLATEIATVLQDKHIAAFTPNQSGETVVKVINGRLIEVSGKKSEQKVYKHHTGYVGNLKKRRYEEIFSKNPAEIIEMAVSGMLPKNRLRSRRLKRLIIEL